MKTNIKKDGSIVELNCNDVYNIGREEVRGFLRGWKGSVGEEVGSYKLTRTSYGTITNILLKSQKKGILRNSIKRSRNWCKRL